MLKNRFFSNRIISLVILLILVSLCGCGRRSLPVTEITLIHGWGSSDPDHVAMRNIYKDFERIHPEIRINLVSMPSADDVIRKVQDMLSVGETPDIIFTAGAGEELLYEFMVDKNFALDLTPYIQDDPDFMETISKAALSRWRTEEGKIYTLSDVLLMSGYWYNEDIFEAAGIREVPDTWDEFILACQRIDRWSAGTNRKTTPIVLDEACLLYLTDAYLADSDPKLLEDLSRGDADLSDERYRQMTDVFTKISASADLEAQFSYRDTLEMFNSAESAMYVNGVWACTMIHDQLNVRYAAFPSTDGSGVSCISSCVGYLLGNSADQEKKDASVEFLKYMLSDDTQTRILKETGQIVSSPRIDITSLSDNERLLQAVTCVQNAGHIIDVPENTWKSANRERYLESIHKIMYNIDTE